MENEKKQFVKDANELEKRLVETMGYCLATDRIMVEGFKIAYMYRETADDETDSGWRFFAGDEDDDYLENASNIGLYDINTIAHYDQSIIPFLKSDYNTSFFRNEANTFEEEPFE